MKGCFHSGSSDSGGGLICRGGSSLPSVSPSVCHMLVSKMTEQDRMSGTVLFL